MPASRNPLRTNQRPATVLKLKTRAAKADRHRLYERSVQDASAELDFIDDTFRALRGRPAVILREDFCGTASVATAWVRRRPRNIALGIDLDPEVLAWSMRHRVPGLSPAEQRRLTLLESDVLHVETVPQDVVLAMNFSYWIFKQRAALRAYFAAVHAALKPDGVFFLDCYGGFDAFRVLKERRELDGFTYIWDQASYNPITGDLLCHIHFRFADGSRLERAFTYDWRLWTLPEIREVLAEAGFAQSIPYWQGWDAAGQDGDGKFEPVSTADADAGWVSYIAALK